jgi:PAS domain S-box-containing protein
VRLYFHCGLGYTVSIPIDEGAMAGRSTKRSGSSSPPRRTRRGADVRALLDATFRAAESGIAVLSASGELALLNPAAEQILRMTRRELLSAPAGAEARRLLGLEGSRPSLVEQARKVGSACRAEVSLHHADGTAALLALQAAPLDPAAEAPGAIAVFFQDITERRRAEEKVQYAEKTFRAFIEHTPEMVAVHRGGKVIYVNPAALRCLEYDGPEPILGHSPLEMVHPSDRAEVMHRIQTMTSQGKAVPVIEERMLKSDGSWLPMEVAALPAVFDGEPAVMVLGIDISARKAAEAERERLLEETQRHAAELEIVLHNIVDAVLVCDAQGKISLANEGALARLGIGSVEEAPTLPAVFHLAPPLRLDGTPLTQADMPVSRALHGEVVVAASLQYRQGERTQVVLASAAPLYRPDGTLIGAVEISHDVSELAEFDRLKDEFIRVAAHELKTPLAIMKGYAQALLRGRDPLSPGQKANAEAIDRGANRIGKLVQDLIDISQLHLGRLTLSHRPLLLDELVSDVVVGFKAGARTPVRLVHIEPARIDGDRERLAQVLRSLLDNAVRYSPQGGDIEVEVGAEDGTAFVRVRDHGVGIPASRQDKIFQRFFRAHTDTPYDAGGLGVGLYISSQIVAQHGGSVQFRSAEGRGSTFTVRLPLLHGDAPTAFEGH